MSSAERDPAHGDPELSGRTAQPRAAPVKTPVEQLASSVGNREFGRMVARMRDGEGLGADGAVHPGIVAAIDSAHGAGRPLDRTVSDSFSSSLGDLSDVRVHTGGVAGDLARAVSARAFTVGTDIFFGNGEYRPGSSSGNELIAHEVAHAVQQRGAAMEGSLTASMPGEPLEVEAEAVARDLTA